jgi:hypothetical protein
MMPIGIHLTNLIIGMSSVALSEPTVVISIVVPTFVELFVQSRKETPVIFKNIRLNILVSYIY